MDNKQYTLYQINEIILCYTCCICIMKMLVSIKRIEAFLCKEDLKPDNVSTSINTGVLNILTLYNHIILTFFQISKRGYAM